MGRGLAGPKRGRRRTAPAFGMPVPHLHGAAIPPQTAGPQSIGPTPDLAWMTVMRVKAVQNEYLECEGWDPWIHGYMLSVNVAKPFLLRDAAADFAGGEIVQKIRFPAHDEEMAKVSIGTRTTTYSNGKTGEVQQEVSPPYFVGDLLIAARMRSYEGDPAVSPRSGTVSASPNVQQTPAEVTAPSDYPAKMLKDSAGKLILWMDLNVAGRRWDQLGIFNAKVQTGSDWTETNDAMPYVNECKLCDEDGSNERGDAFRISLPRRRDYTLDFDPDVYEGDVIPWTFNAQGTPFCVGKYLNSNIGDIKIRNQKVQIPKGWNLSDGSVQGATTLLDFDADLPGPVPSLGRFPKQRAGAEAVGALDGLYELNASHLVTMDNTGAGEYVDKIDEEGTGDSGGQAVENRGPYVCVEFIERYK